VLPLTRPFPEGAGTRERGVWGGGGPGPAGVNVYAQSVAEAGGLGRVQQLLTHDTYDVAEACPPPNIPTGPGTFII